MIEFLDNNYKRIKALYRFTTIVITWTAIIWMYSNGFVFFVAN